MRKISIDREERERGNLDQHFLRIRMETPTGKLQLETDSEFPKRDEARALADRAFAAVR